MVVNIKNSKGKNTTFYSNLLVHIFIPKGMHGKIYFKNYILIQGISC